MAISISKNALVVQDSAQPAQGGLMERIVDNIVNNQAPDYPNSFVQMINQKTGILKHTIKRLSISIHNKPQQAQIIQNMIGLMIAKVSIGQPNWNGNFASQIQSYFHAKALPAAFKRLNDDISNFLMPSLDCGKKPYVVYSHATKKQLNIVAWGAVGYNLVQYTKRQAQS